MPISPELLVFGSFSLFIAIQLFYYLFFFSRLAFHKPKSASGYVPNKPVSIIVCAFNEEANLTKNLPLLLNQDYFKNGKPFFEVIVVNDNSEDDTIYLLNQMATEYPHLHVINLTQEAKLIPGKKFPLSMGIKSARCETILLTDADCRPGSVHWLKEMTARFDTGKEIVLGFGAYNRYPGWLNRQIRFETAHTAIQYLSYALAGVPYMGVGRNLAYKRELFIKNKGFSSHHHLLSGDDDLFINQVANTTNTTICIHPDAFTYSEPKRTLEEWHYQKKRHLSTGKYYKTAHKLLLGTYALSHFLCWGMLPVLFIFTSQQLLLIGSGLFLFRWLVQGILFQRCFSKLKQNDLSWWFMYFDLWLLYYHMKSIFLITKKSKIHWK